MDVTNMNSLENNSFDAVIDKGTMDAVLCGSSSYLKAVIMMKEVQRVLKTDGVFILISSGKPDNRVFHLERDFLSFDTNIFTIKNEYELGNGIGKHEKVILFKLLR